LQFDQKTELLLFKTKTNNYKIRTLIINIDLLSSLNYCSIHPLCKPAGSQGCLSCPEKQVVRTKQYCNNIICIFFCDVTMMLLRSQSISYFNVKQTYLA